MSVFWYSGEFLETNFSVSLWQQYNIHRTTQSFNQNCAGSLWMLTLSCKREILQCLYMDDPALLPHGSLKFSLCLIPLISLASMGISCDFCTYNLNMVLWGLEKILTFSHPAQVLLGFHFFSLWGIMDCNNRDRNSLKWHAFSKGG